MFMVIRRPIWAVFYWGDLAMRFLKWLTTFYNLHLIWPIGNPRLNLKFVPRFILKAISGVDDRPRNEQIDLLISYLEKETVPYIVAGDFNLSQYAANL